jgi:myo-inositol catabolism protein IolC
VFWSPSTDFLIGRLAEAEAVDRICGNYLDLIAAWEA